MRAMEGNEDALTTAALFERAPIGYLVLDQTGVLQAVNRACCLSLGYTREQLVGQALDALVADPGFRFTDLAARHSAAQYVEAEALSLRHRSGELIDVLLNADLSSSLVRCIYLDVTEKQRLEAERDRLIADLQQALDEIQTLRGFLPICAGCKRIRNGADGWEEIETYLRARTPVEFSHGLCPDCLRRLYPELGY